MRYKVILPYGDARSIYQAISYPAGASRSVHIGQGGLLLGAGTLLARIAKDGGLALDLDQSRLFALLAVVFGEAAAARALPNVEAASNLWRQGDKALANLRLIFSGLPGLNDIADVYRLQLAEYLLDQGLSPHDLMRELGLVPASSVLAKFNPNQPRVPAGSGRESGRWGDGSGSVALLGPAASFLAGASPEIVASLAEFAARLSAPTAVLGALFIPTTNSGGVTDGVLPEAPDISFRKDDAAGTLRLTAKASDGTEIVVVAQNQKGLYVDLQTGNPIGRNLGGQLYLDLDAVQDAIQDATPESANNEPDGQPKAASDEPKLCPPPVKDTPHGASPAAMDYEDDLHARVNPLAPLPRGFAIRVFDPVTGKFIFIEDCFRYAGDLVDGDMKPGDFAEAKGPRTAYLYSKDWNSSLEDDVKQAQEQLDAADARGVGLKWYYAEKAAADAARERFNQAGLQRIVIGVMPPRSRP